VRNAGGGTGASGAERSGSRTMSDMPCSEHGAAVGVDTVEAQARKEHPIKNQSAPEHRSRNGGYTLCGVRAQRWPVEGTLWGGAGGQQGISRHCAKPQSGSSTSDRRDPRPSERRNSFLAPFNPTQMLNVKTRPQGSFKERECRPIRCRSCCSDPSQSIQATGQNVLLLLSILAL